MQQRWSPLGRPWPRGANLKSLSLKVKFSASNPTSPRKCPVLGSRIALFFDLLKMGQGHAQCYSILLEPGQVRERAKQNSEHLVKGERLNFEKILRISEQRPFFGGEG